MFMYFVLYLTWTFAYSYMLNILQDLFVLKWFWDMFCFCFIRITLVVLLVEVNNWSLSEQRLNKSHPTNVFYFVRVLSHLQWLKARVCAERGACQKLGVYREVQLCGAEETRDSRGIGQNTGCCHWTRLVQLQYRETEHKVHVALQSSQQSAEMQGR